MEKKGFFNKQDFKFLGQNFVLAIIIGVLAFLVLALWLRAYTKHGEEITVEDIRGMSVAEAQALMHAQGLNMQVIDSTYSRKVPFGTVVEQDPRPNSHAKNGRMVYVTINASSRPQVVMPNLQDMSYRQATTTLRGMGLRVDSTYDYRPSAFRDLVLDVKSDGNSVQPGTKLTVGTRVRLVVGYGQGSERVTVPSVVGMTLQEAQSMLISNRLAVGSVQYDENVEDGAKALVYRQVPSAGTQLVEGETVTLRLSTNPEKAVINSGRDSKEEEDSWF
ncbi:MAG: PASTA domain-containing protein [Paludibacteraceae bacterium]|nr:PASTA domain-containing protein [Paludibacteraceae bacterium]